MNKKKLKIIIVTSSLSFFIVLGTISYSNKNLHKELDIRSAKLTQLSKSNNELQHKLDELIKTSNLNKKSITKLEKELKDKSNEINSMKRKISYNPNNINDKSNATTYHLKKAFKNTKMCGLENAFIKAEKQYGVNALFLAGLVANESDWNDSKRANDGSNNITGHAVYNDVSRGSIFNSKEQCILNTAELIKNHYLSSQGQYYNGVDVWGINRKYSINEDKTINWYWSKDINTIANGFQNKANI